MGSLYTAGKNSYFWSLLSYLQDNNVYDSDRRVVPYTPDLLQDFLDIFPQFPFGTVLSVFVNGNQVGSGSITDTVGSFAAKVPVPQGEFILEVRTVAGVLVHRQMFTGKNYAMALEVAAQSYAERRVTIEQVIQDIKYSTIRSERIYPVVGAYFGFPPPPGWTADMYRSAVLGDNMGCPGFVKSFFYGGTLRGVIETIESITCGPVIVLSAQDGERWVVFDAANAPSPTDPTSPDGWFVSTADDIPLPNKRIFVMEEPYVAYALRLQISGALRSIVNEEVYKATNSFIMAANIEPLNIAGKNLSFTIEELGDESTRLSYFTTFSPTTVSAADAATDILTQNPTLTSAIYGDNGQLRIGVAPVAGKSFKITIVAGSALADLGFIAGSSAEVDTDQLNNPNQTTPVVLTYGTSTFVQGVDFNLDVNTGEIVWNPSTAVNTTVPPSGVTLLATYDYLMKREIESMVSKVKDVNTIIEYVYI